VKRLIGALTIATALLATTFTATAAAHPGHDSASRSGHGAGGHTAVQKAKVHAAVQTARAHAAQRKTRIQTVVKTAQVRTAVQTASAHSGIHQATRTIVLPGATSAEGIATGRGSTFYAGDLNTGDIFRGNLRTGQVALFIDAPAGRNALGIRVDLRHKLLFVAGGPSAQGYVYDLRTGADIAQFQFGTVGSSLINDVAIAGGAAYFTDSMQAQLYRVPITGNGAVGDFETLPLSGPAANLTGAFNLNGIAATRNGQTLIVAHSADATIYTVDPTTGESAAIAGANLPSVDGILLEAGRLWAVQNTLNQVTELKLSRDLSSATVKRVYTNSAFQVPTTIARSGNLLAVVNAKFGIPNPTSFEVVVFRRH
jgi:sugar lactone lactonase YvrE